MTKIIYNKDTLNRSVVSGLNTAKSSLTLAINNCANFTIPSDYGEKKYLESLSGNLKENLKQANQISELLEESSKKFKNDSDNITNSILGIEKDKISLRNLLVK